MSNGTSSLFLLAQGPAKNRPKHLSTYVSVAGNRCNILSYEASVDRSSRAFGARKFEVFIFQKLVCG